MGFTHSSVEGNMSTDYVTYDDHPALGQDAPSIASLNFVSGDKIDALPAGVSIVHFGAKFDKYGCGPIFEQMSKLKDATPGVAAWIAVFTDPDVASISRFLEKKEFRLNSPACQDEGKVVQTAFRDVCKLAALPIPISFVIKDG